MNLNEFNKTYIYKSDISTFGRVEHWQVLEPDKEGFHYGDCEDYILTLIEKVDGFDDLEIWYCKIRKYGHCIGRIPDTGMWIDCNTKRVVPNFSDSYHSFRRFSKFEVLKKKLASTMYNCKFTKPLMEFFIKMFKK